MSEEEIIKIIKDTISLFNSDTHCVAHSDDERVRALEGLLDLYKKQQKEIKNLKQENTFLKTIYSRTDEFKAIEKFVEGL